jgi:hypothetical protein
VEKLERLRRRLSGLFLEGRGRRRRGRRSRKRRRRRRGRSREGREGRTEFLFLLPESVVFLRCFSFSFSCELGSSECEGSEKTCSEATRRREF